MEHSKSNAGIVAQAGAKVVVHDSAIRSNTRSGIVLLGNDEVSATTLSVRKTTFELNRPDSNERGGGAILSKKAKITIEDSTFTRNIGDNSLGGAILCSEMSMCTISGCNFTKGATLKFSRGLFAMSCAEGREHDEAHCTAAASIWNATKSSCANALYDVRSSCEFKGVWSNCTDDSGRDVPNCAQPFCHLCSERWTLGVLESQQGGQQFRWMEKDPMRW